MSDNQGPERCGERSPSLLRAKGVPSATLERKPWKAAPGEHIIRTPTQRAQDIGKRSPPSKLPSSLLTASPPQTALRPLQAGSAFLSLSRSLLLQISLNSEPEWGQEWKGVSQATLSPEGCEEGFVGTTTHHLSIHPTTPPSSLPTCPRPLCPRGLGNPSVRFWLPLCCYTPPANGTRSHVSSCRACGQLKCWRLMSHVCTLRAGRGPPALKLPLA